MPVMKKREMKRGVVVDEQGFIAGEVSWPASETPPNVNIILKDYEGKVSGIVKRIIVQELNGYKNRTQKWDHKKRVWLDPPLRLFVVSAKTGALFSSFNTWPNLIPDLPEGYAIVDDEPPKQAGRSKAMYDFTEEKWVFPRRVAIINPQGEVENIVLENPDPSKPNIPLPEGYTREDDDGGVLPKDDDGKEIGIKSKLKKGVWKRNKESEGEI